MTFAILMLLMLAGAVLLQEFVPFAASLMDALAHAGGGDIAFRARLLFVPAFFFSSAMAVPFPAMLAMAFLSGMAWDATNALVWDDGSPGFGAGPLLFGFFGSIMNGARGLFYQGKWLLPIFLAAICVFCLLAFEYLWINFRAGDFVFPAGIWIKTGLSALLTTATIPFFLLAIAFGMRQTGAGAATRPTPTR